MELVLFERDGGIFALPAESVVQVAADTTLKPLPFPCAPVEGFVRIGERALVAIDLAARLRPGHEPVSGPWSPLPETLEVRGADGPFAIRVRRVLGTVPMLRIPLDAFTIGAGPDDAPDAAGEPVIASFAWHSRRALLLDPDALRVADPGRQRAVCNHRPPHDPAAAGMPCLCGSLPAALLTPPGASPD